MSFTAFGQLKSLYDKKLYSNVTSLANLIFTVSERDPYILNRATKYETYIYYGNSLFHVGQFRKAESIFKQALQFKKTIPPNTEPNDTAVKELMPDTDIKYQMHLCHVKLQQSDQAIDVLQSIPEEHRNAKINMALAILYNQSGKGRLAITAYKEVLKECPLALEAVEGLLNLGVSGAEVGSLVNKTNITGVDWFTGWLNAEVCVHSNDYTQAIKTYKQLERGTLKGNHNLLIHLGEAYYYNGDASNAITTLQKAHSLDPTMQRGLDVLAALLSSENRYIFHLETLIPVSWRYVEYGPEVWTAASYVLYADGNLSRAVHLVEKACLMNPRSFEAFILKGKILYDLKKYWDAVIAFRKAYQIANLRFEPHNGLVMCYIAMQRPREAATIAYNAFKELGDTPRVLTLYASVLKEDPSTVDKAKFILEKVLIKDEKYHPAVYLLCEILEKEMNINAVIALLEKHIDINPTAKLYQMLGDIRANLAQDAMALEHYYSALSLDPNNTLAINGIQLIELSNIIVRNGSSSSRSDSSHMSFNENEDILNDSDLEASS